MIKEHAYRFGRAKHLIGVTGLPSSAPGQVGILVLNAGLVHRIGPFRLHVEMTRHLNACGYPTLRFDLSTLGDSGASGESQSREEQVRADVADAMALLNEQSGCTRFVLIGLCSGAGNAHLVAHADARVVGAVFLDGHAYRTLGFYARHYLPRLLHPASIGRFLKRQLRTAPQAAEPAFNVATPPPSQLRGELTGMLERGLKLCFIYSGASGYFNHPRQFRECFGRRISNHPGTTVSFFMQADHTYILAEDRQRLLDTIGHWLLRNFPPDTAGARA